ncbi:MAG: antitoxin MazE-like protein [Caulobacteraceae bacterium]
MPRASASDGLDRFQRYRDKRRREGLRLVRLWAPDPMAEGFREEAARQAALLRGAPEEVEALDYIDAAGDLAGA